jgi:glycosyltransferase involved in cell wall biosynthesis
MPDQPGFARPLPRVSLFTAGKDSTYALGLARALAALGCELDFIGSDELTPVGVPGLSQVRFFNLRGESRSHASLGRKIRRVLVYYGRLIHYAATARPKVFHILWVNKFEWFDHTVLMLYYKLLGKKICFTAHNVNQARRDGHDSWFNRLTLKIHYQLCHHIFVHTAKMKDELIADFSQPAAKISVIPLGMNVIVPVTGLTPPEARQRLGLGLRDKVILFFGNIAPYKGLEFLVEAFQQLARTDPACRLVIAGRPKGPPEYWAGIRETIARSQLADRVLQRIEFVPEAETEWYFKAADVSVLPYVNIFQSGVLVLSYTFGLPVIAAGVGSLREEILEGKTGFVHEPRNAADLARMLQVYFDGGLYRNLDRTRAEIQACARDKYSWTKVAALTTAVYVQLTGADPR